MCTTMCASVCVFVSVCVCLSVCVSVCVFVCIVCGCIYMYVHLCVYTHTPCILYCRYHIIRVLQRHGLQCQYDGWLYLTMGRGIERNLWSSSWNACRYVYNLLITVLILYKQNYWWTLYLAVCSNNTVGRTLNWWFLVLYVEKPMLVVWMDR